MTHNLVYLVHASSAASPILSWRALISLVPRAVVQTRSMHSVSGWSGLNAWRSAPIDERRVWGKHAPAIVREPVLGGGVELEQRHPDGIVREGGGDSGPELKTTDLANWGALVLGTSDPLQKAWLTHQAFRLWTRGQLELGVATAPDTPGRPAKPELVPPRQVPSPKECALSPSAHLLHNLAHIELNAIDLAWDTVVRFSYASEELGTQFFADFLHVADDESRHFRWCSQRLNELGFSYGDMPAHNLLWKDCMKTSADVKSRLAVIPMMQEARGLDAGPRLVKRLMGLADHRSAAIVRRIGAEEIAHVGVGVFHFLRICEKLRVDPGDEFKDLMVECNIELYGPFNHIARAKAGLQREWYDTSGSTASENTQPSARVNKTSGRAHKDVRGDDEPPERDFKSSDEPQNIVEHKVNAEAKAKSSPEGVMIHTRGEGCSGSTSSSLAEIYERLALVVAMEKENAEA